MSSAQYWDTTQDLMHTIVKLELASLRAVDSSTFRDLINKSPRDAYRHLENLLIVLYQLDIDPSEEWDFDNMTDLVKRYGAYPMMDGT